jgi:hypothetical protein
MVHLISHQKTGVATCTCISVQSLPCVIASAQCRSCHDEFNLDQTGNVYFQVSAQFNTQTGKLYMEVTYANNAHTDGWSA